MQQMQQGMMPQDPRVAAAMADVQRKAAADQANVQIRQAELQLDLQKTQLAASEQAQKMQQAAQREVLKQDRLDNRQAAELQVKMITNREDNTTAKEIAAAEVISGEKVGVSTGTGINP